ncbi:MAG: hypothetical protein GMKNLPBB_00529 [Myxococcota bacterium]|nr:hypothetical protein [Myxococcota bacterium]
MARQDDLELLDDDGFLDDFIGKESKGGAKAAARSSAPTAGKAAPPTASARRTSLPPPPPPVDDEGDKEDKTQIVRGVPREEKTQIIGGMIGIGMPAKLVVLDGSDVGREIELRRDEMVFGRGGNCDFVSRDLAVSRRHFSVKRTREGYHVVDLGSGNGTLVNNIRITDYTLHDGDEIKAGHSVLRFEWPQERAVDAAGQKTQVFAPVARMQNVKGAGPEAKSSGPSKRVMIVAVSVAVVLALAVAVKLAIQDDETGNKPAVTKKGQKSGVRQAAVEDDAARKEALRKQQEADIQAERIGKIMNEGREAMINGRYDDARAKFEAVLVLDPGNSKASEYLTQARDEIKKKQEADAKEQEKPRAAPVVRRDEDRRDYTPRTSRAPREVEMPRNNPPPAASMAPRGGGGPVGSGEGDIVNAYAQGRADAAMRACAKVDMGPAKVKCSQIKLFLDNYTKAEAAYKSGDRSRAKIMFMTAQSLDRSLAPGGSRYTSQIQGYLAGL